MVLVNTQISMKSRSEVVKYRTTLSYLKQKENLCK